MVLAATAEEMAAQLHTEGHERAVFQIGPKWRDEARPRAGALRGREFVMADGYSLHTTQQSLDEQYERVTKAYSSLLQTLERPFVQAVAGSGAMGGSVSHEWLLLDHPEATDPVVRCECGQWRTQEVDRCGCGLSSSHVDSSPHKGLEVGHTFQLGRRYGPLMGCYGVGVSRLLASLAVPSSSWPVSLASYHTVLVLPPRCSSVPDSLLNRLLHAVPSHAKLLIWDDPNPRVSLATRTRRARLLLPPRIVQYVRDTLVEIPNE